MGEIDRHTALLTTATMIPLALGPLVYGYLLEHVSTRHLLTAAFGILTAAQFALAAGPDYPVFLALLTLLLIGVLVLSLLLRHARVQADPAVAD